MATLTETFTNIADAIRLKTETTDKITPENMPSMIEGISVGSPAVIQELTITSNGTYTAPQYIDGYSPITVRVPSGGTENWPENAFVWSGPCNNILADGKWQWFFNLYKNQIRTENIVTAQYMLYNCISIDEIPFDINLSTNEQVNIEYIFGNTGITEPPKIIGMVGPMSNLFMGCQNLQYIPESFYADMDWSWIDNIEEGNYWDGGRGAMFWYCSSMTEMPPVDFLNHGPRETWGSNTIFNRTFQYCHNLQEIVDMPIPHYYIEGIDGLDNFVEECYNLRKLTFALGEDGNPQMVKWGGQTLNLCLNVGWEGGDNSISVYDLESAIETIHSLPDATNAINEGMDMNTIVFSSTAGANNRGAIGDITEEEIAVAAAKGWTVSFA